MLRTTSVLALGLFLGLAPVHAQTQTDTDDTTAQQGQQVQSEQQQTTEQSQQQTDQQQTAGGSGGLTDDSMMVDEMIGSDVYSQDGEESIGSIDDVLISVDGEVEGVVVGVGGWLGVGQRDVLISFDQLSLERQEDEFRLVSQMSREELESQPEFERAEMRQRETTARQQPGAAGQDPSLMGQQAGTTVETDTQQRETTATRQEDTGEQGETVAEIETADDAQVEQDTAQQGTAQQDTAQQDTGEQGETVGQIETADEETAQVDQQQGQQQQAQQQQGQEQQAQQQQGQQQAQQQEAQQQDGERGRVVFQDDDTIQASTMLGTSVRSEDDEDMGEINDIIISLDGNVEGYVVGVGGFLGIGQKDVILSTDRIDIVREDDDVRIIALETRENLESAPAFERPGSGQQDTMQQGESQTQQDTQTQD